MPDPELSIVRTPLIASIGRYIQAWPTSLLQLPVIPNSNNSPCCLCNGLSLGCGTNAGRCHTCLRLRISCGPSSNPRVLRSSPEPARPYMPVVRICSKCFNTVMFASMNLSTQFCMHGSSDRSSLPEDILPVMHLRKQMSVREWIAVGVR